MSPTDFLISFNNGKYLISINLVYYEVIVLLNLLENVLRLFSGNNYALGSI